MMPPKTPAQAVKPNLFTTKARVKMDESRMRPPIIVSKK
jgi:hypothetical protein